MAVTTTDLATGSLGITIGDAIVAFNNRTVFKPLVNSVKVIPGTRIARIPIYTALNASDVENNEGSATTIRTLSSSPIDIPVERHSIAVSLSNLLMNSSGDNVFGQAGSSIGGAISEEFDTEIATLAEDFTQSVGSAGSALTIEAILEARTKLIKANINGAQINLVLSPEQWSELSGLLTAEKDGGRVIEELAATGYVRTYRGINIYESNCIQVDSSDDATGIMFVSDAISVAFDSASFNNLVSINAKENNLTDSVELVGNAYYNLAISKDSYGVKIISDVS